MEPPDWLASLCASSNLRAVELDRVVRTRKSPTDLKELKVEMTLRRMLPVDGSVYAERSVGSTNAALRVVSRAKTAQAV